MTHPQPSPHDPQSSPQDPLSALATQRVLGPTTPVAEVLARGRRLRRRRVGTVAATSLLTVGVLAGGLLTLDTGPLQASRAESVSPAAGLPNASENAACTRLLEQSTSSKDGMTIQARASRLDARDLEDLAYRPVKRHPEGSMGDMMVNAFDFPCPAPAMASGLDIDSNDTVTSMYALYGPESSAQHKVFHPRPDEKSVLDRRTVTVRGVTATVTTADTADTLTEQPRGLLTRVEWVEQGGNWTFDLVRSSGFSETENRDDALAAVAALRLPNGTIDMRSLPDGYEWVAQAPRLTDGRSVGWGATYEQPGSDPVQFTAVRVPKEYASVLSGVAPGDLMRAAAGDTAVWSPATHTLTLMRPGGVALTIQPTGSKATREEAVAIAERLSTIPADDPGLSKALDNYLKQYDTTH